MVKVQKPQSKSLSKSKKIEGIAKEKKKVNNGIKITKASDLVVTSAEVESKKIRSKNADFKQKDKKVLAHTKGAKLSQKSKPSKKPLVLAPPDSPTVPAPRIGKKIVPVPDPAANEATRLKVGSKQSVREVKTVNIEKTPEKQKKQSAISATKNAKKQPQLAKNSLKKLLDEQKVKPNVKKAKINKKVNITKKEKATKKKQKNVELNYELKQFDEDKFNEILSKTNVQKVSDALKCQVAEEVQKQKATSIFSDYRFMLQVCCYKIPSCPKRVVKLALKHSLVGTDDDVAVIVTDLQRGARFDYEPTVQHYEDLLREAGVEQRLSVVPFNRLRNDMGTFEAKRKFLNSFDYLLCDGRISGQASAFLGKSTQKPRNVLHAVRLSKDDQLPKEISRALCRTAYRQLRKGDLIAIPVGNHEHSGQQLAENILFVIEQLQQQYPGGLANIRSMYLKIDIVGTSALPLYISMCAPPVDTPYVVGPREQRMLKLKKQANEVLTRFALTKDVDFVKLTWDQVKHKAELREKRNALKAADKNNKTKNKEVTAVPAKKARKSSKLGTVKAGSQGVQKEVEDEETNN